jgi:hypothetical protein
MAAIKLVDVSVAEGMQVRSLKSVGMRINVPKWVLLCCFAGGNARREVPKVRHEIATPILIHSSRKSRAIAQMHQTHVDPHNEGKRG